MNSLNSLYFPGTTLCSVRQYPLYLLFSKIHLLKVAEHNIHGSEVQATDSFTDAGLCQPYAPSPLGDDFERFSKLIKDIKDRKDDYTSQLSALTVAAMSSHSSNKGDSQQEIISSLLSNGQLLPDKDKKQRIMALWQARLVLAIGEILDYEEEDIALQLAILKDEEAELFKELKGAHDNLEAESLFKELTLLLQNINPPAPENMKKRFFSWKQLYREGYLPPYDLLITTSKDTAEQILESFESENSKTNITPLQLFLPAIVSWHEEDAAEQIRLYRENNREILNEITRQIHRLKTCDNPAEDKGLKSDLSQCNELWEKSLEVHFPVKEFGRIPVLFHCFTGIPCSTLLGAEKQESIRTNGLIAVIDISPSGA